MIMQPNMDGAPKVGRLISGSLASSTLNLFLIFFDSFVVQGLGVWPNLPKVLGAIVKLLFSFFHFPAFESAFSSQMSNF